MNRLIIAVRLWAEEKGLASADPAVQFMKMSEELGEVAQAYTRNLREELEMELGDLLITIIIFAEQNGINLESALKKAYEKIANRNGKMIGGTFVKEEDLYD